MLQFIDLGVQLCRVRCNQKISGLTLTAKLSQATNKLSERHGFLWFVGLKVLKLSW